MSKKLRSKIFQFAILILIFFISVFLFMHSAFFEIDKITITGLEKLTKEEVLKLSELKTGVNIFRIDEQFMCRTVEIHPLIKSAKVIRHLPRTVEMQVEERKIWALVPYQDMFLCIDNEGICIDKINSFSFASYLIITLDTLPERVNIGQAVHAEGIGKIRQVWEALSPENRKKISDFHYISNNKEIVIYTARGTQVKFGKMERLAEKAEFFNQIFIMEDDLQKAGVEELEYVDLRFKGQPVVKTRS
ncbi:MAG: FtsQ-type POTRA domain-containing protein [Syntrophomonadaceae bacterium]|nr:FtsQ-type POTRA domain-containing protein [Syntrophomonadaceae bacterium]